MHTWKEVNFKKKKLWTSLGENVFCISMGEILLGVNKEVRHFDDNQQKVN